MPQYQNPEAEKLGESAARLNQEADKLEAQARQKREEAIKLIKAADAIDSGQKRNA